MPRFKTSILILLSIILSHVSISGSPYRFHHLGVEEGLSQNTILSITQDRKGNMWFATYDGIDQYDGYNFRSYNIERHIGDGQFNRIDTRLLCDSHGNIWATTGTLSYYDPKTNAFTAYEGLEQLTVIDLAEITYQEKSILLLATDCGLKIGSLDGPCPLPDFLKGIEAIALYTSDDTLIVADSAGVLRIFSLTEQRVVSEFHLDGIALAKDILKTDNGSIWVATDGKGLIRIKDSQIEVYNHRNEATNSLCSNYVRTLCQNGDQLWIGTGNGLSIMSMSSGMFTTITGSPHRSYSLSHNSIKSIYKDADSNLWIGTYYGGVNYCLQMQSIFSNIKIGDNNSTPIIGGIAEDYDGTLWIGTARDGVFHYNPGTHECQRISLSRENAEMDDIKAICFSKDGKHIYFGTGLGGLSIYSRENQKARHFSDPKAPRSVYSIIEEDKDHLWIGALSGLYLFDLKDNIATQVFPLPNESLFIYSIFRDSNGTTWIGSESDLISCKLSIDSSGKPAISTVTSHDVRLVQDIHETKDHIWVATRDGLYRKHKDNEHFECDSRIAISSRIIRGIEEDRSGMLWISTDNGLNRLNPEDDHVTRFYSEDGLPGNTLGLYAHCYDISEDIMYFGGVNGLFSFCPTAMVNLKESHNPTVNSLLVNGVKHNITNKSEIRLKHFQNSLTFSFSVPNHSSWKKNVFYYRLIGSHDYWATASISPSVVYSNLRPGKYIFELMSENSEGTKCDLPYKISIQINPIWYKSTLATIVYILLVIFALIFGVAEIVKKTEEKNSREIERIRNLSQEEIGRQRALRYALDNITPEDAELITKAVTVIEKYLSDEAFGVEQMASELCMSRSNLYLKIRSITGRSPLDLIKRIRMEKACQLLRNTQYSIATISTMVGFSSPSYFTSCFKKQFGVLPGKFK